VALFDDVMFLYFLDVPNASLQELSLSNVKFLNQQQREVVRDWLVAAKEFSFCSENERAYRSALSFWTNFAAMK
jgi:hypothetical protein